MLPADPVTGKRKSVRRFGLTEADVRKKLRKLVDIIEDEGATLIPIDRMTFAELAKEYEENELIPAEYIGGKKVAGRRDLRSSKAWPKSLTEHFRKKRLSQITFGNIKAYKLVLIRRPVRDPEQNSNDVRKEVQQNSNGNGDNGKRRSIGSWNSSERSSIKPYPTTNSFETLQGRQWSAADRENGEKQTGALSDLR